MEIRHRKKSKITDLSKRLEMKINEHKMLTNTLHEAFRKDDTSASTLDGIKRAIEDTLNDIAMLRDELERGYTYTTYEKSSFFDKIKKADNKNDELPIRVISDCEHKYSYKKPYNIKSFDEILKNENGKKNKVTQAISVDAVKTDNILFCNRFLCDLSIIGVPETMVKWVCPYKGSENFIEVQIYDFVDDNGIPVLAKLNAYDGRKFTIEIEHLDPTGYIVYREKYNGCYLDGEFLRDSLRYVDSEPSTITFKVYYDGVSYEANFQKR